MCNFSACMCLLACSHVRQVYTRASACFAKRVLVVQCIYAVNVRALNPPEHMNLILLFFYFSSLPGMFCQFFHKYQLCGRKKENALAYSRTNNACKLNIIFSVHRGRKTLCSYKIMFTKLFCVRIYTQIHIY